MSRINSAIYEIHHMDMLAARDQWINRIHPLIKLILTVIYIAVVVSFHKYDVIGILGMATYLIAGFILAELSFKECLWRLRVILPLVCMVGITNPFFDRVPVEIGFLHINAGVVSMFTFMIKGTFAVLASYILIATTSIEKLCYALSLLHIPKIIVTQILLTYRYITVLLGEVNRITQAYSLRAPTQKGVHFKVWGSLTGQLLLRSIDRANEVFESMTLRGYHGEFRYVGEKNHIHWWDMLYFGVWIILFFLLRKIPVIIIIGNWVGGIFA